MYGFRIGASGGNSVISMSMSEIPQMCMGCSVLIFSEMVQHTTFWDESIMIFFSCAISQSFSVVPRFISMALMPRKQRSALMFLILAMASAPIVILAFFDTRSPIMITSIFGCIMY